MRARLSFVLFTVFATLLLVPSNAPGRQWSRTSTVVFDRSVQVPGQVLPAGIYVFKLADTNDRNVVQIWNAEQTILYTTVMGFPEYMSEAAAEDRFVLEQKDKDKPAILKSWFHEGNANGERFLYPKDSRKPRRVD